MIKIVGVKGHSCYHPRRTGDEQDIPGLTDTSVPLVLVPREPAESASCSTYLRRMMFASAL
uniref:Uncharacterized protein n=1 Tax=Malurus cyaneus samueli TaxID=2593467 RepID=A0A8C5TNP5_9PASS